MGSSRGSGAPPTNDLEDDYLRLRDEHQHLKRHARDQEEKANKLATRLTRIMREKSREGASSPSRRQVLEMEQTVQELGERVRTLEKHNTRLKSRLLVTKQVLTSSAKGPYAGVQARVNSGLRRPAQKTQPVRVPGLQMPHTLQRPQDVLQASPYAVSLLQEAKNEIERLEAVVVSQRLREDSREEELLELVERERLRVAHLEEELSVPRTGSHMGKVEHLSENMDALRVRREQGHWKTRAEQLEVQLTESQQDIAQMEISHERLLKEADLLASQLKFEQQRNLSLQENLNAADSLQRKISELEERLVDLEKENSILKEANKELLNSTGEATGKEQHQNQDSKILESQIAQLEAIIASDIDEKSSLITQLAARNESYRRLQEEREMLQREHNRLKTSLEGLKKELQLFREQEGIRGFQKQLIPEDAVRNVIPRTEKACHDKEIQTISFESDERQARTFDEELQQREDKVQSLLHLLEERNKQVEALKKQLDSFPSAPQQLQMAEVCAADETDDKHHLSLVQGGQSFFEIHFDRVTWVSQQVMPEKESPVFASWSFSDFESQSSPVCSSHCPEFNCTARYAVDVDTQFLEYLREDFLRVRVQQTRGPRIQCLGSCWVSLRGVLDSLFIPVHRSAPLIGLQDDKRKRLLGTLSYWICFLPAPSAAKELFNISVPSLLLSKQATRSELPACLLPDGLEEFKSSQNKLNVCIIGYLRARPGTAGEAQTVRCLYQLCELPQHVTNAASGSNFVTLHDNYSFTVTVNRDFHGQLLSRSMMLLVLDEEDTEEGSYIGRASVPLALLAKNEAVRGAFQLINLHGEDVGAVEVELSWDAEYKTPLKPMPKARSRKAKPIQLPRSAQEKWNANDDHHSGLPQTIKEKSLLKDPSSASTRCQRKKVSSKKSIIKHMPPESSSLTSISSFSSFEVDGTERNVAVEVSNPSLRKPNTKMDTGVLNESPSNEDDSNGQLVVVRPPALARSSTFKVVEAAVISVISLSFLPGAQVLKDKSVQMIFVEYQFLDCPPEELETPFSLPKPKPLQSVTFNFRKVIHLDAVLHPGRRNALTSMLLSKKSQSAVIKFVVVSEPVGKNGSGECKDIGTACVDLKQILRFGRDIIEESIDLFGAKDGQKIGTLKVSVEILSALRRILPNQHTPEAS